MKPQVQTVTPAFFFLRRFVAAAVAVATLAIIPGRTMATETVALGPQLDALFDDPIWSNARWGVKIIDLESSKTLYERDPAKGFIPASNLKLYTTAAALEYLGADYRFETKLYLTGALNKGVLKGDILIVGSGDPSISGRYNDDTPTTAILNQWVDAVRTAGIRRIEGAVVGDDDTFDESHLSGTWQLDYFQEWYAAENSGLAINENCWDATVTPGPRPGAPARVKLEIPTQFITVRNEVVTTAPSGKKGGDPPVEFTRDYEENIVTVRGFIPADAAPFHIWGGVRNGTLYTATLLREALTRAGIKVARGARDIDDIKDKAAARAEDKRTLLTTHVSPPMSRIVAIVNKPSQNFYADQLLKVVGRAAYNSGDYNSGERAVRDMLTTAGLEAAGLQMHDGSGLSRQDLVEPRLTAGLLAWAATRPWFQFYHDSLPIAGVDGTIRSRMKGSIAENVVHAKTGYIGRVRSLSGYTTTTANRRIVFSMMNNNYLTPTKAVNDAQDAACVLMMTTPVD
ncbi:D-alanyl-D-alanine carboxypeptidase/D-alanyl-D-alanine-endopeptidase [candidate division BRC1 bacterium HGW-BRC1-1]|jgi:D-alanyl-D-alanine carboxypeptidase/D-alanyl-D-alanine-endopeptidase (penicillin-binding protein 4)|nr:MAG: D-alanyl-D-alanine carboxypeptidase/D-alanyl-D-alanine-endopeptidase [candidate division BRC1 bacterium HGW-BRC1-1]